MFIALKKLEHFDFVSGHQGCEGVRAYEGHVLLHALIQSGNQETGLHPGGNQSWSFTSGTFCYKNKIHNIIL